MSEYKEYTIAGVEIELINIPELAEVHALLEEKQKSCPEYRKRLEARIEYLLKQKQRLVEQYTEVPSRITNLEEEIQKLSESLKSLEG